MKTISVSVRVLFSALCAVLFVALGSAASAAGIQGIYVGSMHLTDGVVRDIPLSISLVLNNDNAGAQYIDGKFVVDDEGGPYVFSKVTYDIDNNRMDMKYSRQRSGDSNTIGPVNLRLVGALTSDFTMSGSVTSGIYGDIGTFKVVRSSTLTVLPIRVKYDGLWEGMGYNFPAKSKKLYSVQLSNAPGTQTINPANYELEFTPGHLGGYTADGYFIKGFTSVSIDYLRRKISLTSSVGDISMDLNIDFATGLLSGIQRSATWGLTSQFDNLKKVSAAPSSAP